MSISASANLSSNALQTNRNNAQNEAVATVDNPVTNQQGEKQQKSLSKEEMAKTTSEMTKFMELINSDIQFQLHEKTKQLIVQVVDTRDGTVLKEFPPHELLDTMAKIREYVGFLLDKKV